jgi:hypothetical protein
MRPTDTCWITALGIIASGQMPKGMGSDPCKGFSGAKKYSVEFSRVHRIWLEQGIGKNVLKTRSELE